METVYPLGCYQKWLNKNFYQSVLVFLTYFITSTATVVKEIKCLHIAFIVGPDSYQGESFTY